MRPFYILDVFAEKPYTGNQLAVFLDAGDLSTTDMLTLTREMNYSESTFILSRTPEKNGYNVRIFTPTAEVPFAGHPTLGTAHIIRSRLLSNKPNTVILNLKAGQIPVTFNPDGYGWMIQLPPTFGPTYDTATLSQVLGLSPHDLDERFPIQEVSTGLPFFIVPLKTINALKTISLNREKFKSLIQQTDAKDILVFCPETHEPPNDISVRVFAEYQGIPEDPATGSANGCLAAYLVKHRYFGTDAIDIRSEQGYEIHRPSLLLLRAQQLETHIQVQVGGKTVMVAEGKLV